MKKCPTVSGCKITMQQRVTRNRSISSRQ